MFRFIMLTAFTLLTLSCSTAKGDSTKTASIGFYSTPTEIIQTLKDVKDKAPAAHFMLALAYNEEKQYKAAIRHFAESAFKYKRADDLRLFPFPVYSHLNGFHIKSDYYDDAVNEIASIFQRHYGENSYALKIAELQSGDSVRIDVEAASTEADALSSLKRYSDAVKKLNSRISHYKDSLPLSALHFKRASVYEKADRLKDAASDYLAVMSLDRDGWRSDLAAIQIYRMVKGQKLSLKIDELVTTAARLLDSRKDSEASELTASIKPEQFRKSYECAELMVREAAARKKIREAESLIKNYGENEIKLRYALARELWKRRAKGAALGIYRDIAAKSEHKERMPAVYRLAEFMESNNRSEYMHWINDYLENGDDPSKKQTLLWLIAKRAIENDPEKAVTLLKKALSQADHGPYSDRIRFWLFKLSSASPAESEQYLRGLITGHPSSTYTWSALDSLPESLSQDKLHGLLSKSVADNNNSDILYYFTLLSFLGEDTKKIDTALASIPADVITPYKEIESLIEKAPFGRFRELEKYFAAGSADYIRRTSYFTTASTKESKVELEASMTSLALKYGNHTLAAYGILNLLNASGVEENIALMGEKSVRALLPYAYRSIVDSASKEYKVDPFLVLSVIKAESFFNHEAVSSAGAAGLMQLMPSTARGLARQMRLKDDAYSLKDPADSISFGAKYLSWLDRYFTGNLPFMVAGYNAGPGNVNKWKKRLNTQDMDYFTEFVPFDETNYYIVRTGKYLKQYRLIYGRKTGKNTD